MLLQTDSSNQTPFDANKPKSEKIVKLDTTSNKTV